MVNLRTLHDVPRNGRPLRKGAFYARGIAGGYPRLRFWSWALADHLIGGWNYAIEAGDEPQLVNLPATLITGKKTAAPCSLEQFPHMRNFPQQALLARVDAEIAPYAFYKECQWFGASVEIPITLALEIAPQMPMPVLFTHPSMPLVDKQSRIALQVWDQIPTEMVTYDATPFEVDWGIVSSSPYSGETHWMVWVLEGMYRRTGERNARHLTEIMPPVLAENILFEEQLFGVSWVTHPIYVAQDGDTDDVLTMIANSGIEPVRLGEEQSP